MTNKLLPAVTALTLAGLALSFTAWAVTAPPRQGGQPTQAEGARRRTLRDLARERDVEVQAPAEEHNAGNEFIVTRYRLDVRRSINRELEAVTAMLRAAGRYFPSLETWKPPAAHELKT